MKKRLLGLFSIIIGLSTMVLSSCSNVTPTVVNISTPSYSAIPSLTSTPTALPTLPSTPTTMPTQIPFPVQNGQSIPDIGFEVLSKNNISRIMPIAEYGAPRTISVTLDPQNDHIFITTVDGIQILDAKNKKIQSEIRTQIPLGINMHLGEPEPGSPIISGNGQFILLFSASLDLDLWSIDGQKLWSKKMVWKKETEETNKVHYLSASISPDAELLAQSYCINFDDCKILLTATQNDEKIDEFVGSHPQFTNGGKFLTYSINDGIGVYDIEQHATINTISVSGRYGNEYSIMNIGQTNRIAIVQWDRVLIWDLESNQEISTITGFPPGYGTNNLPNFVKFSPDGNYLLVGTYLYPQNLVKFKIDGTIIIDTTYDTANSYWIENNQAVKYASLGNEYIYPSDFYGAYTPVQFVFKKNELTLYGYRSEYVEIEGQWEKKVTSRLTCVNGDCQPKQLLLTKNYSFYNDNGTIIEISGDKGSRLVDIFSNDKIIGSVNIKCDYYKIIGVTNHILLFQNQCTGTDTTTQLIDLTNGTLLMKWTNAIPRENVTFSDNLIAFKLTPDFGYTTDGHIYVFDTNKKTIIMDKTGFDQSQLILSEKNNSLLLIDDKMVTIDLKTKKITSEVMFPTPDRIEYSSISSDNHSQAAISKNEDLIAISTLAGSIDIYDELNNAVIFQWNAHMESIDALVFSDDGRFLASYSGDGYVKVWGIPQSK